MAEKAGMTVRRVHFDPAIFFQHDISGVADTYNSASVIAGRQYIRCGQDAFGGNYFGLYTAGLANCYISVSFHNFYLIGSKTSTG
jgi:hypothetical protein